MNDSKFNIVTVITNKEYEKFLILFLNSLFRNTNTDNLNSVYILEKNVREELKISLIKKYGKIIFENKNYNLDLPKIKGVFRHDWRLSVLSKSMYVYEKVLESNIPTVLIDLDSFFIKNFSQHINTEYDIQVCERENQQKIKRIIASYISFNNKQKSICFLEKWISLIKALNEDVVETKSLNLMSQDPNFKIERLSYKKISYYYGIDEVSDETAVFHLKGCNPTIPVQTDVDNRIKRLEKKYSVDDYLSL